MNCQQHKIYISRDERGVKYWQVKKVSKSEAPIPSWRPWPHALLPSLDPLQVGSDHLEFKSVWTYAVTLMF